jgi:hypothetical protein
MKTPGRFQSLSPMLVVGLLSLPPALSLVGCGELDEAEGSVDEDAVSSALTRTDVSSTRALERNNPWVVEVAANAGLTCKGTVIHPYWVLTAAHCLTSRSAEVRAIRTNPTTGALDKVVRFSDARAGIFVHPQYREGGYLNDIGLVKLAYPFDVDVRGDGRVADGQVMTAALPRAAAVEGRTGTIVKNRGKEAAGYTPIVRAPQMSAAQAGKFHIYPAVGSICSGDSGSGFLEMLDGRVTVVGVASAAALDSQTNCLRDGGLVDLTDVFSFRSWIYATMGMSADQVDGQVRLRWSGATSAPGFMSLQCQSSTLTPVQAPMNVPGSEIGMNCAQVRAFCTPEGSNLALSSFTLRTFAPGGALLGTQALPFLSSGTAAIGQPGSNVLRYDCGVTEQTTPTQVGVGGLALSGTN